MSQTVATVAPAAVATVADVAVNDNIIGRSNCQTRLPPQHHRPSRQQKIRWQRPF
ncbi:MAG: hypothetical protein R3C44_15030 [Chloroflexota bacterium]